MAGRVGRQHRMGHLWGLGTPCSPRAGPARAVVTGKAQKASRSAARVRACRATACLPPPPHRKQCRNPKPEAEATAGKNQHFPMALGGG